MSSPFTRKRGRNSADPLKKGGSYGLPMCDRQQPRAHQHAQRTACCGNGRAPHRAHRGHQRADAGKPPRHAFSGRALGFGAKRHGRVRMRRKALALRRAAAVCPAQPAAHRRTCAADADAARQKAALAAARHCQNRKSGRMSGAVRQNTRSGLSAFPRTRRHQRRQGQP